jgi:hypothetical protein
MQTIPFSAVSRNASAARFRFEQPVGHAMGGGVFIALLHCLKDHRIARKKAEDVIIHAFASFEFWP